MTNLPMISSGFWSSAIGVRRVLLLGVLGDTAGTDHLDVVVHQRARRSRLARGDEAPQVAMGPQHALRYVAAQRAVAPRPGDVLQRDELEDQHAVMRGGGDADVEIPARA